LDHRYKFIRIIRDNDEVDSAADKCNVLLNQELKQRSVDFAYWLTLHDDIFDNYKNSKIPVEKLYDTFLNNLI
jgi:hypothetical protein